MTRCSLGTGKYYHRGGERGQAGLALLVAATFVMVIGVSLVGLMNTDMRHAAAQYALLHSYYVAQAGLEEATAHVFAAADPAADATPAAGVTAPYGGGRFTYWVDAGPAAGCGQGLKTLEALGQAEALGRVISTRVRACAVPGVPFLAALFGVSEVKFQGVAQTYLAPYDLGTPGGGGNLGSFTEVNFADNDVRLNALSEDATNMVTVRDRTVSDYMLFGFSVRPDYNPTPSDDATPWILGAFGDLIKAQPTIGVIPNPCGTPYGCVTVGNSITDIPGVHDLRGASYLGHVYLRGFKKERVLPLFLDPDAFRVQAEENTANAALNRRAGLGARSDSYYTFPEMFQILSYLARNPSDHLHGTIYANGPVTVLQSVDLGGPTGDVTLAVEGDLIIPGDVTLVNRHDLTTVSGRRTPGIVLFASPDPLIGPQTVCNGQHLIGSGRLVMCERSKLIVDGLVYTQDGMVIESQASVDQVGAMYHNSLGSPNPSFVNEDGTVVLRFDPLALSAFGRGISIVSWQQLH